MCRPPLPLVSGRYSGPLSASFRPSLSGVTGAAERESLPLISRVPSTLSAALLISYLISAALINISF
jgi:hypothetical protein